MSYAAAVEEYYASGDTDGVVLWAAELDHATFEAPIYLVAGIEGADPETDTIALPLEAGGTKVAHTPCGFMLTRPGHDKDGPTDAKVLVDNVAADLEPHLEAARGVNSPLTVTFRSYRAESFADVAAIASPDDVIEGLEGARVSLKPDGSAEATLQWPDGRTLNIPTGPHAFISREEYPDAW
jgi:hypothetical protein